MTLCRWSMRMTSGEWERCSKDEHHDDAHTIGTVTIGKLALLRLWLHFHPTVRRVWNGD